MCKANERIEAWIIAGKMCNQIEGHAEVSILLQAPIYPLIVPCLQQNLIYFIKLALKVRD